jgi:hypothetical protein
MRDPGRPRPRAGARQLADRSIVRQHFRMRIAALLIACASLLLGAAPAAAGCSGAGLEREYRAADVVARVRVMAETRVMDAEPSAATIRQWGDYFPVALYRLRVVEVFKGRPGPQISFFQEISSGRFDVDLDRDYLIFFTYYRPSPSRPAAARGAMYVRYACGESKPWRQVDAATLTRLRALSRTR